MDQWPPGVRRKEEWGVAASGFLSGMMKIVLNSDEDYTASYTNTTELCTFQRVYLMVYELSQLFLNLKEK